jgi:hypothetical protein
VGASCVSVSTPYTSTLTRHHTSTRLRPASVRIRQLDRVPWLTVLKSLEANHLTASVSTGSSSCKFWSMSVVWQGHDLAPCKSTARDERNGFEPAVCGLDRDVHCSKPGSLTRLEFAAVVKSSWCSFVVCFPSSRAVPQDFRRFILPARTVRHALRVGEEHLYALPTKLNSL